MLYDLPIEKNDNQLFYFNIKYYHEKYEQTKQKTNNIKT